MSMLLHFLTAFIFCNLGINFL